MEDNDYDLNENDMNQDEDLNMNLELIQKMGIDINNIDDLQNLTQLT